MLQLAYIVNNYGEIFDGVGVYGRIMHQNFPTWIETTVYTSKCHPRYKLKKMLTLGMTWKLFKVCRDLKYLTFDVILIEYPFVEWQPLIFFPIWLISKKKSAQTKIILSLHEYLRCNRFRRMMAKFICKHSDAVLITDEVMRESVKGFAKECYIRPIPSNVYDEKAIHMQCVRDRRQFVFFGLVNPKTKAFHEMLEAWDDFNQNGNHKLCLISSTELGDIESKHKGVSYIRNANDLQIIEAMKRSTFCLLPIKPCVDVRSGTFKIATMAGCVCLGKFSKEFQKLPFVINVDDYQPNEIKNILKYVDTLDCDRLSEMSREAEAWGMTYTPKGTATLVAHIIEACALIKGDDQSEVC